MKVGLVTLLLISATIALAGCTTASTSAPAATAPTVVAVTPASVIPTAPTPLAPPTLTPTSPPAYSSEAARAAVHAAATKRHMTFSTVSCPTVLTGYCGLIGRDHTEVGEATVAVDGGRVIVTSIRAVNAG